MPLRKSVKPPETRPCTGIDLWLSVACICNVAAIGYTVKDYLDFFIAIGYIQGMTPQQMQEWRARMGWTQEQAAVWLGVQRGTINRYENGRRAIPQMAENLCNALEGRLLWPDVGKGKCY